MEDVEEEDDDEELRCFKFPPIVSVVTTALLFAVHFASVEDRLSLKYGSPELPNVEWHASLSAVFAHLRNEHVIYNALVSAHPTIRIARAFLKLGECCSDCCETHLQMLIIAGGVLELTEGPFRFAAIWWASSTIGYAYHGVLSQTYAIGASGVAYGITCSQVPI